MDETGWYEGELHKWIWVNATAEVTSFQILPGRSSQQARQVIDERSLGVITSDRHGAYNWIDASRRQICWSHLKRDFQVISDRERDSAEVECGLLEQTKEVFRMWYECRDGLSSREQYQREMKPLQQRVKQMLETGSRCTSSKTRRTCQKILKRWLSLWTFVQIQGMKPTNNAAERALRRGVMWRRKSFGTQSEGGSQFVARILTVVTSLRQQGRDVLKFLTAACSAVIGQTTTESLIPDSS